MKRLAKAIGMHQQSALTRKAAKALVLAELSRPDPPITQRAADSLANEAKHRSRKPRR